MTWGSPAQALHPWCCVRKMQPLPGPQALLGPQWQEGGWCEQQCKQCQLFYLVHMEEMIKVDRMGWAWYALPRVQHSLGVAEQDSTARDIHCGCSKTWVDLDCVSSLASGLATHHSSSPRGWMSLSLVYSKEVTVLLPPLQGFEA